MLKILGILCTLCFAASVFGQSKITVKTPEGLKTYYCDSSEACNKGLIYTFVEQTPSYKGGLDVLEKSLNKELEIDKKLNGEIKIWFVVNCVDKSYGFQVIKSVDFELEKSILAFLSKEQNWVSGKQKGKAVDCSSFLRLKVKKGKIKIINS